ncbi:hypothetical protein [Bhargavaea beijingensis]|uniref:Uncharacterized protein n=1 Tax=Bhargavaea beijingensis TaxID=426756 RepID=A0A1G6YPA6_9BACL|nr:hypothetical protein [Bhargavaea beijingensis]MCW1928628.1 hypothetical protein [Bhargavaea beijingensis]RSK36669.1 hypothetical protein EJA12_02670 [Bhargavaea beijingensis]SDD92122.1 hypothetical protein SAMN04488126_10232 [Bhargavaea beijingensis]
MNRNKMMMTALGLGAAYLMRNKESRDKLKGQFNDFAGNPKSSSRSQATSDNKKGGVLTNFFS